jgi:CSLREA domain-containing protein
MTLAYAPPRPVWPLVAAVVLALLAASPARAQFTVTKLADTADGTCDADCSLREAVNAANGAPSAQTVTFDPALDGGEIDLTLGQLAVTDGTSVDASALPDGITVDAQGGSRVFETSGTTALTGLTITGGGGGGGGIFNTGDLTVARSTLSGNTSSSGGAIYNAGTLTVANSTISGNTGGDGGGIYNEGGTLTVTNSTISGNASSGRGSKITGPENPAFSSLRTTSSSLNGSDGGGIYNDGTLTVGNTVLERNSGGGNIDSDRDGTVTSLGFNVCDDACGLSGPGDQTSTDPLLGPLADNGGPTPTHAPLDGSPVVDIGGTCGPADQRGFPAPTDGDGDSAAACDAGSVEAAAVVLPALACMPAAPLSFDFDGDGVQEGAGGGGVEASDFDVLGTHPTFGEFAAVRNESAGAPVDLDGCSFIVFDPFDETVTYADNVAAETPVAAGDTLVFATQAGDRALPATTLPDGPGAFALVTGAAQPGDDVLVFAPVNGQTRVVAAVVYDEDRNVFGSVQGGATPAQMNAFLVAMAEAFGQATSAEGDGPLDLSVAVWPNPSAGRARVAFGVPEPGDVRVAVYDALGREVAVLAEGPHGAGRHTAVLDAGALAPGAYVVRVAGGAGVRAARLTVAR